MKRKTVCITGSSRGIGRAAALKFAFSGYDVVISSRNSKNDLEKTRQEIERCGAKCLAFFGDMGNADDCKRMMEEIEKEFSSLDVLVNNAGISYIGLLQEMKDEEWNQLMQTDLNSAFYLSRLSIPLMLKQGYGKIINISSVWGNVGASCETAYSAAKGGINALTKALAKELAPSDIQVNAIAMGAIDTSMNAFLTPAEKEALLEEIPAGRMGTPEEAADFIFTIAEAGPYLTGQIIGFNGGWQC